MATLRSMLCALLLCAALIGPAPAARADTADINAAARSVVRVVIVMRDSSGYDVIGHGTGFAVAPKLIVTNAHVLAPLLEDDRLRLGVVPAEGRTGYFARVVRVSRANDLALIELTEEASLPVVTLYSGEIEDGSDVFAVGYPANVDQALGIGLDGLTTPQVPVKTRGALSGGVSAAQYDTLLHTAPIGVGNSGGPLLDACGRVVGVNAFGTISENGSDSEFYFAVSTRELAPFLRAAGVKMRTNSQTCRSIADFDAAQGVREMRESAMAQARSNAAAAERRILGERAARRAELEAFDKRETLLALAGIFLALAVSGAFAAFLLWERDRREIAAGAAIFSAIAIAALVFAWAARPGIAEIEKLGSDAQRRAMADAPVPAAPSTDLDKGRFTCRIVPDRSRVTVSDTTDVPLQWQGDGCVNGQTQYGLSDGRWSRVLVPRGEQTVSVTSYDPASRTLQTDRFLVDLDIMSAARKARSSYQAPACGAGESAARELAEQQDAIRALLPSSPNERLVYSCTPAEAQAVPGAAPQG